MTVIVNLSQWRTQDVEGLYAAAFTQSGAANGPEFVVFVPHGWGRAAVDLSYQSDDVLVVSTPTRKVGPGGQREVTPLEALSNGREIDNGSFGQLAVSLKNAITNKGYGRLAPRTLPKWARDLTFVTRGKEEAFPFEEWKRLAKLLTRRFHVQHVNSYRDEDAFVTPADMPAILKYARFKLAAYTKREQERRREEVREARTEWRKTRREDRVRSKALDTLEAMFRPEQP